MSVKSFVGYIHKIKKGKKVSYGGTWQAKQDSVIAVVPIGYADGVPRALSNKGMVLIRGELCPIAGIVCMDYIMIDVTTLIEKNLGPVVGDEVTLIGKQKNNIAFGDYLGSAVANTLLFGLLILLNGNFGVTGEKFFVTAGLMIAGLIAFYISASSKRKISRFEGCVLICFYILFLITQISALLNPHI